MNDEGDGLDFKEQLTFDLTLNLSFHWPYPPTPQELSQLMERISIDAHNTIELMRPEAKKVRVLESVGMS